MNLTIIPGKPLQGETTLPGDKSISHRTALFAALAEGESRAENFLVSGVTRAMLDALTDLGVPWELHGASLRVSGQGLHGLKAPVAALNCGNSATTMRLLAGGLAASGTAAVLDGTPGLRRRPMGRIVEPLRTMGVQIEAGPGCGAPLQIGGRPAGQTLHAVQYALPVASAQVKGCLLLAALAGDGVTTLYETGLSRDHSETMLRSMGVHVATVAQGMGRFAVTLLPPREGKLRPLRRVIPGDFSAAAFLIVAALITPGSQVTLRGVGLNPTRTGLLSTLQEMGADIRIDHRDEQNEEPTGDLTVRHSRLHGVRVRAERVVQMIDEFPIFGVAAAYAQGISEVSQAEELRFKESDRIGALVQELHTLGVDARETADGFVIQGQGGLRGGKSDPHGDHRLAMSMTVAGLAARDEVQVMGAEVAGESFPGFVAALQGLGAGLTASE